MINKISKIDIINIKNKDIKYPEKSNIKIIKATHADVSAIQEITKEAFSKYADLAGITSKVEALKETRDIIHNDIDTKNVFIAFLDEIPIGSVRIEIFPDKTAYLSRFGVKDAYQSMGVGKKIIDVVDKTMQGKAVEKIYLHTASKVASLIRFYYACGFYIKSTSTDKGYLRALLCKEYLS